MEDGGDEKENGFETKKQNELELSCKTTLPQLAEDTGAKMQPTTTTCKKVNTNRPLITHDIRVCIHTSHMLSRRLCWPRVMVWLYIRCVRTVELK
jgi:hypothetical protein